MCLYPRLYGSLTRLKTLVYKINGAKYIKVYMKHNGELNPGIIPKQYKNFICQGQLPKEQVCSECKTDQWLYYKNTGYQPGMQKLDINVLCFEGPQTDM